jgi:hypothetical protein
VALGRSNKNATQRNPSSPCGLELVADLAGRDQRIAVHRHGAVQGQLRVRGLQLRGLLDNQRL